MSGKVYLVGAGLGDPELITVKGLRLLQSADVVVYDRLAHPEHLQSAKATAKLINVGKLSDHRKSISQAAINQILVEQALLGQRVVRLKGGDPFVFGRGSEEALELVKHGIAFEIVPGVSSAIAAGAYAGIPVTHRHVATAFTVIAGAVAKDSANDPLWVNLPPTHTLVILMGVRLLPTILHKLLENGRSPHTPAAIIAHATAKNHQQVVVGTLATLAEKAANAGIQAPAVTIIGDVVQLHKQISWFQPLQETMR